MINNIKSFLLGIIAAAGALFLEIIFSLAFPEKVVVKYYFETFTWLLLIIVFIEELAKATFVLKIKYFSKNNKAIIKNSFFLGIGFGLTEFAMKNIFQEEIALLSALPAFLIHILTCFLAGLIIYRSTLNPLKNLTLILFINIIIHLSYNLLVIYLI